MVGDIRVAFVALDLTLPVPNAIRAFHEDVLRRIAESMEQESSAASIVA
jgi:hypothetical protein